MSLVRVVLDYASPLGTVSSEDIMKLEKVHRGSSVCTQQLLREESWMCNPNGYLFVLRFYGPVNPMGSY